MGVTTKKVFTDQTVRSYIVRATIAFDTEAPLVVAEDAQNIAWRQGDLIGVKAHPLKSKRQIYVLGAKGSYGASPTQFPLIKANLGYEQVTFSKVRVLEGTDADYIYDLVTIGRVSTTDNLAEMVWTRGGVSQDDVITQQREANNFYQVTSEAERLSLVFGDTLDFEGNEVEVKKGLVVEEENLEDGSKRLYTLVDTIVSSPDSWVEISSTLLDAFLELLIEQPVPVVNARNIALTNEHVWEGDSLNRPVPTPVGITIIGSASLVAGTITIEDDLITPESIVTLSPTTTGTLTGILRYTISAGQVIVESRNTSNVLINTDTVTFGFNIETGVNDTIRKSKYILVNDPIAIAERNLVFNGSGEFLQSSGETPFTQWERTQAWTYEKFFTNPKTDSGGVQALFRTRVNNTLGTGIRGISINIVDNMFILAIISTLGDAVGSAIRVDYDFSPFSHIAVTYDGSSDESGIKLYLDGGLHTAGRSVFVNNLADTIISTGQRVNIMGSGADFTGGAIKETSFTDYAKTPSEILADVAAGTQLAGTGAFLLNVDLRYPTTIKTLNTTDINLPLPNNNALLTTDANEYKLNFQNFPAQLVLGTNLVE